MERDWTGNSKSVYSMLGATSHSENEREKHDYYATDPLALEILLPHIELPSVVWEPACGGGHLAEVILNRTDSRVICSDKYKREYELDFQKDFLEMKRAPVGCTCILTNPPYKYATEFVLKSLELLPSGGDIYMFLRTQFLEGKKRYNRIFHQFPPVKVFQFVSRIKAAKNGKFDDVGQNAVSYAWFWWKKDVYEETKIKWIM